MILAFKKYETTDQKRGDFIRGIVVCVAANLLLFVIYAVGFFLFIKEQSSQTPLLQQEDAIVTLVSIACLLPLILNSGALLYTLIFRSWMGLGMMAGAVPLIVAVICLSVVVTNACSAGC